MKQIRLAITRLIERVSHEDEKNYLKLAKNVTEKKHQTFSPGLTDGVDIFVKDCYQKITYV